MVKCIFIILFFFSINKIEAQRKDDLKAYYYYTNKAELANIGNDFKSSLLFFDSAFSFNKHSFAIDKYHAGIVSLYCKEYEKADELFIELVELGMSYSFFERSKLEILQDYLSTKSGKRFIKRARNTPLADFIDKPLRYQLFGMKEDDRYYRLKKDGYTQYRDSIIRADAKNGDLLKEMIERYKGLPGEYITGIDSFNIFYPISYILLFHHSEGMFSQKFDFSDDVFKAIQTGTIRSSVGATLLERANQKYKAGGDLFALCVYDSLGVAEINDHSFTALKQKQIDYCFGYHFPNKNVTMDSINKFRELLLLEPFDDFKTKVYFEMEQSNPKAFVMNRINLFVLPWSTRKEYEYACKMLKR